MSNTDVNQMICNLRKDLRNVRIGRKIFSA